MDRAGLEKLHKGAKMSETFVKTAGYGDNLPGEAAALRWLAEAEKNFAQYYGTAGPEFVRYVVANLKLLRNKLPSLVNEQAAVLCRSIEPCDPQIRRVAKKFALYQIAGHLASVWGILPHTEAEIDQAVEVCFDRWLSRWGGHNIFGGSRGAGEGSFLCCGQPT